MITDIVAWYYPVKKSTVVIWGEAQERTDMTDDDFRKTIEHIKELQKQEAEEKLKQKFSSSAGANADNSGVAECCRLAGHAYSQIGEPMFNLEGTKIMSVICSRCGRSITIIQLP